MAKGIIFKTNPKAVGAILKLHQAKLKEFAQKAAEISKRLAPVISGNLKRSIDWDELEAGRGVIIFTATGYGGWVEIGTSKFEGRRFIARGVNLAAKEILGKGI